MAGLAVVLAGAVVVGGLLVAGSHLRPAAPRPIARVTPAQATPASPLPDPLAADAFKCAASLGLGVSGAPPVALIDAVRVEAQTGYERVTIAFANGRPHDVVLSLQQTSTFTSEQGGGQSFALKGQAGALLTIHGSDGHTDYRGSTDIVTKLPTVLELRQILDSGGTVQWAIGLSKVACYRVSSYDNPARLVVDVQAG